MCGKKRQLYLKRGMAYNKIGKLSEAKADFQTAEIGEWFNTILPELQEKIVVALSLDCNIDYRPPVLVDTELDKSHEYNPNGEVIIFHMFGIDAGGGEIYDAKTGKIIGTIMI